MAIVGWKKSQSLIEISSSQPIDVQKNKFSKQKSAQQTIKKNKTHNNKLFDTLLYTTVLTADLA
jgi:hypothetical protein